MGPSMLQIIFGLITVASALLVVMGKNPVVSAMALMATLFSTAVLYFGLGFYFIGVAQILIYAGAIAVLFVFVVMLLDMKPFKLTIPGRVPVFLLGVFAAALLLAGLLISVVPGVGVEAGHSEHAAEELMRTVDPKSISLHFLSKYMIPFQLTGLLILAAIMGVILLGRPKKTVQKDVIQ